MTPTYYTPRLEEFHLGFELEAKKGSGLVNDVYYEDGQEWKKTVVQHGDFFTTLNPEHIRVKYLDREGIEDLEWSYEGIPNSYERNNYILSEFGDTKIFAIKIQTTYVKHTVSFFKTDVLFEGRIKNKSELRRLMIQLGIIDNDHGK